MAGPTKKRPKGEELMVWPSEKRNEESPTEPFQECGVCGHRDALDVLKCDDCGYDFPQRSRPGNLGGEKRRMNTEPTPPPPMVAPRRLVGPLWRCAEDPKWSLCASADLRELDWSNWWQDEYDGTYLHVLKYTPDEGDTWHRVQPRNLRGRKCTRVAVWNGVVHWLFDSPNDQHVATAPEKP